MTTAGLVARKRTKAARPEGRTWGHLSGHLALILAAATLVFVAATRPASEPTPVRAALDPAMCDAANPRPPASAPYTPGTYIGTKIYASIIQVVCHDRVTALWFDSVELGGAHWNPAEPTRLTADHSGVWQLTGGGFVNGRPSEDIVAGFRKQGTDVLRLRTQVTPTEYGGYLGTGPTTVRLEAGEYVELIVYQDDAYGGSDPLAFGHDTSPEAQSWMEIRFLGD